MRVKGYVVINVTDLICCGLKHDLSTDFSPLSHAY